MSHTQRQEFWIFRMSGSKIKSAFHVPFVKDISSIDRHPVEIFSILGVLQHEMPANIDLKRWRSRSFWQLIWCFVDLVLKRQQFPGSKRTHINNIIVKVNFQLTNSRLILTKMGSTNRKRPFPFWQLRWLFLCSLAWQKSTHSLSLHLPLSEQATSSLICLQSSINLNTSTGLWPDCCVVVAHFFPFRSSTERLLK